MTELVTFKNALLIDDDNAVQLIYKRIIKRSGLIESATSCMCALDALEYLRRSDRPKVDIIFLDVNMPAMSGFEFLDVATREFGLGFSDTVVVMLTTSLNQEDIDRAAELGIGKTRYFNKPLTQDLLRKIVSQMQAGKHHINQHHINQ